MNITLNIYSSVWTGHFFQRTKIASMLYMVYLNLDRVSCQKASWGQPGRSYPPIHPHHPGVDGWRHAEWRNYHIGLAEEVLVKEDYVTFDKQVKS